MKKTKKILSIFLALLMIMSIVPMSAITATAQTFTGTCGSNLRWYYDDSLGILTIAGSGDMYDFDSDNRPWEKYTYGIASIEIGSDVTSIGAYAFYDCEDLESVTIPDSIIRIGDKAFWYCDSLTSVNIPDSVVSIGDSAFRSCDSLESIIVDDNNKYFSSDDYGVLYDRYKTKLIQYPIAKKETKYIISDCVNEICDVAFEGCDNLVNVVIPDSVTTIGNMAFAFCTGLEKITIPNKVTTIGNSAFWDCSRLTSIVIPDSVTAMGNSAFSSCENLANVVIGNGVAKINDDTFSSCIRLTSVKIGNNVTSIGEYAFDNCTGLTKIVIPDSVTSIGYRAFSSCENLKEVTIGSGVSKIYAGAFFQCFNITDVYYKGSEDEWYKIGFGNENSRLTTATIHFNSTGGSTDDDLYDEPEKPNEDRYYIFNRGFTHNLDYYAKYLDSSTYDTVLSNMMAALSKAVYSGNDIALATRSLGFDKSNVYDYYGSYNPNTCGYSLSFKQSDYSDDIICLVAVRGTQSLDYNADWYGNLNIMTDSYGHHSGFQNPANRIYESIQQYIYTNQITKNVKFFVTGHSRGGAVANLLSVKLMENGVASSNIYNYNFACPDVACKYFFATYYNIFNLCNREDVVPFVPGILSPLTSIGTSWDKYGQTYWFTKDDPNTVNAFSDHDMDLYLNFFDQQLKPSEWGYSFGDKVDDAVGWCWGWVAKVLCPVNVVIVDEYGKNIASVINGEINYYDSDFGDVIICTYGEEKFIYVNSEKIFNVELIGTDTGTMTYSVEKCNLASGEIYESKTFNDVMLEEGKTMYSPASETEKTEDIQLFVTEEKNGERTYTHIINENGTENEYYSFSIKEPSRTTIRHKDGIILHLNIDGRLPENSKIEWYVNNDNFDAGYLDDGISCVFISKNNGYTIISAVIRDENNEIIAIDQIELRSKAGFFDKIGGFFRSLFGSTKIYEY